MVLTPGTGRGRVAGGRAQPPAGLPVCDGSRAPSPGADPGAVSWHLGSRRVLPLFVPSTCPDRVDPTNRTLTAACSPSRRQEGQLQAAEKARPGRAFVGGPGGRRNARSIPRRPPEVRSHLEPARPLHVTFLSQPRTWLQASGVCLQPDGGPGARLLPAQHTAPARAWHRARAPQVWPWLRFWF